MASLVLDRVADKAAAVDRNWFAEHPTRVTYARAALLGEFADTGPEDVPLVFVRKLDGGNFARAYCPFPNDLDERTARVFALLIEELFERISAKHSGRTAA